MKLKYIWEEKDIICGTYIIKETSPKGSDNLNFARTVTYKIGFDNNDKEKPVNKISCLTDGWVCPIAKDEKEFAEYLNNDEHGFRPLTKEEYLAMINSTNQGFL